MQRDGGEEEESLDVEASAAAMLGLTTAATRRIKLERRIFDEVGDGGSCFEMTLETTRR